MASHCRACSACIHSPTNLNGMLMPVTAWGVKLISIGMFAGADRAILWRGPRLQRSLEQFLSDVWWGEPDVLCSTWLPAPATWRFPWPRRCQRRTRGGHHPAGPPLLTSPCARTRGPAGADEGAWRGGEHELLRAQGREAGDFSVPAAVSACLNSSLRRWAMTCR